MLNKKIKAKNNNVQFCFKKYIHTCFNSDPPMAFCIFKILYNENIVL